MEEETTERSLLLTRFMAPIRVMGHSSTSGLGGIQSPGRPMVVGGRTTLSFTCLVLGSEAGDRDTLPRATCPRPFCFPQTRPSSC